MNIGNKNYYLIAVGVLMIAAGGLFFIKGGDDSGLVALSPSPSLSVSPEVSLAPGTSTPKPSPRIDAKVDNHDYLALQFDEDGNRRLVLNNDCSALVPSQVVYKNNVRVMLDNSYSENPHTLKIGSKEYTLAAGEWRIETLSSTTLPARLQIFCGFMELGEIELR